jgi:hypothetical protein
MRRTTRVCLFAIGIVLGLFPYYLRRTCITFPGRRIRDIAESAYIFAYPLLLVEFTRNGARQRIPSTQQEFPSATFRTIVRPHAYTLYSNEWLELSKEPVLLHVPDTGGLLLGSGYGCVDRDLRLAKEADHGNQRGLARHRGLSFARLAAVPEHLLPRAASSFGFGELSWPRAGTETTRG